jgi:vesicle transport through interaction with t-SNAREs protein 1
MADAYSLRQQLSPLVDQITEDVDLIESTRNLSSKHRVEKSLDNATKLASDLERFDPTYGREFKQRINSLRQRLENASRISTGITSFESDPEVNKLGQEQRGLLARGYASIVRTGDRLRTANEIAHETEQIGHGVMADLTTQREVLLRTQDKLNEGNENITAGSKILRLMYGRVIFNKVLLVTIILVELAILGLVIYLKFFSKK